MEKRNEMEKENPMKKLPDVLGMNYQEIANKIGLNRGDNLRNIAKGRKKSGIDEKLAEKLIEQFPNLNKVWLLTGYGQMTIDLEKQQNVVLDKDEKLNTKLDNPDISIVDISNKDNDISILIKNNTILVETNAKLTDQLLKLINK